MTLFIDRWKLPAAGLLLHADRWLSAAVAAALHSMLGPPLEATVVAEPATLTATLYWGAQRGILLTQLLTGFTLAVEVGCAALLFSPLFFRRSRTLGYVVLVVLQPVGVWAPEHPNEHLKTDTESWLPRCVATRRGFVRFPFVHDKDGPLPS